jgi:Ca-activated chloride channel family protein
MSHDMPDDPFDRLKTADVPPASREAKKRALAAGVAAFEAAREKTEAAPKGNQWDRRLTSIISFFRGKTIMDMRLPIGTAAIVLLLPPLGYQLYTTNSMTTLPAPAQLPAPREEVVVRPQLEVAQEPAAKVEPQTALTQAPVAPEPMEGEIGAAVDSAVMMESMPAPPPPAAAAPAMRQSAGAVAPSASFAPTSDIVLAPPEPSGDQFTSFEEQRLKLVAEEPVSTFSIDVDTASYGYVRRMLEDGLLPEPDAVRIEEMINYFPYDYPAASNPAEPFQPTMAVFPTPWNAQTQLLQIGIKGYAPPAGEDKAANLVFLIDTSGSMDEPDKLPLLKRAFALLVDQLSANDTVSIVAYAGSAGVVLEPTAATNKSVILQALDNLWAGGSTAGAEGIELAYRLAEERRVGEGGTNRVILATDGDFNVGIDDPEKLKDFITAKRDSGISLSVLGFGRGNLDDATMQALAQNGNGNASYIGDFREARKVLVEEVGGTLDTIAKDVKIQVEFNPAAISEYRLIGYETRALNREDFNNDRVDAGDIGAGHTVTALYEITPAGSAGALVDPLRYGTAPQAAPSGALAFLRMRYKLPESDVSQLIEQPVTPDLVYADIGQASDDARFAAAVAAFGQKLKGSRYGGELDWDAIADLARSGRGEDASGYRNDFVQLVQAAKALRPDVAGEPPLN